MNSKSDGRRRPPRRTASPTSSRSRAKRTASRPPTSRRTLGVGGDRPDESTIVFRGGEFQARGQWKKGMRVRFMVEGTIDAVELSDKRDRKLNVVTGTKRKHGMTVEHVEALPAAQD
jgi:hypothetical protein